MTPSAERHGAGVSVAAGAPLLEARAVTKRFGGLTALSEVSMTVRSGEIFGLIGPNGAGKTTFFNCLTGLYHPSSGSVHLAGVPLTGLKPHAVAARGLARTFQNIRLFANMSVLENVMVGRHVRSRAGVLGAVLRGPGTRAEERSIRERSLDLLDSVGLAAARGATGQAPVLWGSAALGDRPRTRHRAAAAGPGRARGRDEPDRDRGAQGVVGGHPRPGRSPCS